MRSMMLIDASHPEETRVVITENGAVQDYDFSIVSKKQIKGNIYLAKVTRVEASLQAAFIEYGGNRQGFLPFSEIHPHYYQIPAADKERLLKEEEKYLDEEEGEEENRRGRRGGKKEDVQTTESEAEQPSDVVSSEDAPSEETEQSNEISAEEKPTETEEVTITEEQQEVMDAQHAAPLEAQQNPEVEQVGGMDEEMARPAKKFRFQKRYKIQEVIKKGQVILVQAIKEERGNKGAAFSTYMSLPGRYCVLMPNTMRSAGISRRISDQRDRQRLKSITDGLDLEKGMSVIIRTAGIDRSKPEIKRDFEYLIKLWNTIRENTLSSYAPSMIYEEADIIKRSLRDLYTPNIDEILIHGDEAFKTSKEMMKAIMPSHAAKVKQYTDEAPIFHEFEVERQLRSIHEPSVKLRSGGYIVFGTTEALVAIDVNSGRSTSDRHIEETATRTNLEAAVEIARQLKMRDLAGLIVIDFIDMMEGKNRRAVEKALKEALRSDRAKIQVGRISNFGLLEMTRQRLRPSITDSIMELCPRCSGHGMVKNREALAMDIIREIETAATDEGIKNIKVETNAASALFLLNSKRSSLSAIESRYEVSIEIEVVETDVPGGFRIATQYQPGAKPQGGRNKNRNRHREERESRPAIRQEFELNEPVEGEEEPEESKGDESTEPQESGDKEKRFEGRGGGRKRIPGKGGRHQHRDKREDNAPHDENAEAQEPAPEGEVQAAETTEGEESGKREGGRRGGRRNWKKDGRDNRGGRDRREREPKPESDTEQSDAPKPAEKTETSAGTPAPRPKKKGIEKISEFKARERKKEETPEPVEVSNDDNPNRPKRSGWWSKIGK